MTSQIQFFKARSILLTICGPQVHSLIYCKRLKCPTIFKKPWNPSKRMNQKMLLLPKNVEMNLKIKSFVHLGLPRLIRPRFFERSILSSSGFEPFRGLHSGQSLGTRTSSPTLPLPPTVPPPHFSQLECCSMTERG